MAESAEYIFFDCDDSLYRNNWATMLKLDAKERAYCSSKLDVPESKMSSLYKMHGTTALGLIKEGYLDEAQVVDFLDEVYEISLDDIKPDPALRAMLKGLPRRRWVFTAATKQHAHRCLQRIGIEDLFEGVIACSSTDMFQRAGYVSKHDSRCFEAAMDIAGVSRHDSHKCMLLDDSASNLKTAKAMGWQTVQVGLYRRDGSKLNCPAADFSLESLHELYATLPGLFRMSPLTAEAGSKACTVNGTNGSSLKRARSRILKPLLSTPERQLRRRISEDAEAFGA
mmetsp:Transcript_150163/g.280043  ORF Transcript_150163/g.280043 Transcript_150163/m.280043 type:complete len:283 (+) Transcript_150163:76-924(+)